MPLPSGSPTVTVTGQYIGPDGTPLSGSVTFTPATPVRSASGEVVITGSATAKLDSYGRISVALLATDADVNPTGWTYRVVEQLAEMPAQPYDISLPQAQPTVDLSTVEHIAESTGSSPDQPATTT
jgi:23S rRNA C2498 (ribose-2'-O)-methylase RlmM